MNMDEVRARAYELLRGSGRDRFLPIRLARGVLVFVNDMAGRPLASKEELEERREYERIRAARAAEAKEKARIDAEKAAAAGGKARREAAPVVVYVDGRSGRDLKRISDVLKGRDIPWTQADVEGDDATRSWVYTTAKVNELPIVFIAGQPIGGFQELVQADASGELVKMVYG
jgi:hypothetical protein